MRLLCADMRGAGFLWVLGTMALAGAVNAQALPEGARTTAQASEGKTEITDEKIEAAERAADDKDGQNAEIAAGGLVSSGNARQVALTGSGKARVRRGRSQLSGAAAINYAEAAADRDSELETTMENLQGRIRYDFFFAEHWAAFLGISARRVSLALRGRASPFTTTCSTGSASAGAAARTDSAKTPAETQIFIEARA